MQAHLSKTCSKNFFPTGCLKYVIFSHLSGLHLLSNAYSAKNIFIVNATLIESKKNYRI